MKDNIRDAILGIVVMGLIGLSMIVGGMQSNETEEVLEEAPEDAPEGEEEAESVE